MILIKDAKENIGNKVIYTDWLGNKEEGIISSVNHVNVFVKYGGQCTAQATNPSDLTFL